MTPFSERLAEAVRSRGTALCVGIDPRWGALPTALKAELAGVPLAERLETGLSSFCETVLELAEPFCRVVKPQAAFFEQYGLAGFRALDRLLERAREMGFVIILDAKRGDIASTAQAYAEAAFAEQSIDGEPFRVWRADALTVNPYLGEDSIEPFVNTAKAKGCGLFVLVRTSNAGAGLFQDLRCDGEPVYRHVARAVARWNEPTLDSSRLGAVGAVVGATHPKELAELRELLPNNWLLVPGYGAQGGTAADVRAAYRPDGLGAIVNSSRGVTFPFHVDETNWKEAIRAACDKAARELAIHRNG